MTNNPQELREFARSVDQLLKRANDLNLTLPAYLLKMAKLDLTTRIFGIDDAELTAFSNYVREGLNGKNGNGCKDFSVN